MKALVDKLEDKLQVFAGADSDQDFLAYNFFEEKHNLLESLTLRQLELIELIEPTTPQRILNIGCCTGISAIVLYKELSLGQPLKIFALDNVNALFLNAKYKYRNIPGLYFLGNSAKNVELFFQEQFDNIFYTPSLFQSPNFRESLQQVSNLLVPGGVVCTCHFSGLFTEDGENAFLKVFPEAQYNQCIFPKQDQKSILGSTSGFNSTFVDFQLEFESEFLLDLLSTPKQKTHPLFPEMPDVERTQRIREVRQFLEREEGRVFAGWEFFIARKEQQFDD
jgi:SAM-dependent methyltransferase